VYEGVIFVEGHSTTGIAEDTNAEERRLLANEDMTRPASVPGGRLGRLSDAVVDEWIRSPFAMLTAIGNALWLMLVTGARGVK